MQRSSRNIIFLTIVALIVAINSVLWNIGAAQLQTQLGPLATRLILPLAVLSTVFVIGYGVREQLQSKSSQHPIDAEQVQRSRKVMLAKVRQTWITGLLDPSIARDTRIALILEHRPDAVIDPVDIVIQRSNRAAQLLPAGSSLLDIYDQLGGALLILGAPGAGKTTLLLELARSLLDRAAAGPTHSISVVFPLSSWAAERKPLVTWLADELVLRYQVSRKLAEAWLDADAILPLLDGLDEVAVAHRDTCVDAINRYRQDHGTVPLVVCSRIADYEALTTKLQFQGAVVTQPLGRDEVSTYLRTVGVPAIPRHDSPLWDVLDTPLMLSIAAQTYAGQPFDDLVNADPTAVHDRLFSAYVEHMFRRNNPQRPFTNDQTRHYLAYLAYQMRLHSQTTFYLEQLQPDWLPPSQQQRWKVLSVLICTLLTGVLATLVGALLVGSISALIGSIGGGLSGAVSAARAGAVGGAVASGLNGLLVGTLSAALIINKDQPGMPIQVVEALSWSWSEARSAFTSGIRSTAVSMASSAVLIGLLGGVLAGARSAPTAGLSGMIIIGSAVLIFDVLIGGMTTRALEHKVNPNQGVQNSGQNALGIGLSIVLTGIILVMLIGTLDLILGVAIMVGLGRSVNDGIGQGLSIGLIVGLFGATIIVLISALLGSLRYGGLAYLQHYVLRLLLIHNGSIPYRLVQFLDYATQRIFLRRVGGGYIFIHRLLLEHFAAQYSYCQQGVTTTSDLDNTLSTFNELEHPDR